jgi:hypothetical protein
VPSLDVLPRPAQASIPLIVAGRAQQDEAWLAENMDGPQATDWAQATGGMRPFISAFHLDLLDDPDAPMQPIRFGA